MTNELGQLRFLVRTRDAKFVENPEGFCSTDQEPYLGEFRSACKKHGLLLDQTFVSIRIPVEKPVAFKLPAGRSLKKYSNIDSFGHLDIELDPAILAELYLICSGDFKTVMVNSLKKTPEYLDERVAILEGKTPFERYALVAEFSEKAIRLCNSGYAEARLLRCLKKQDRLIHNTKRIGEV